MGWDFGFWCQLSTVHCQLHSCSFLGFMLSCLSDMLELLGIFALLSWLLILLCQFLSHFDFFPSILVATLLVPALTFFFYSRLREKFLFHSITLSRTPLPPEMFYWNLYRQKLLNTGVQATSFSILSGILAFHCPVFSPDLLKSSIGILATLVFIPSLSTCIGSFSLYIKAAQWFECPHSQSLSLLRKSMYWISDNPDFLPAPSHEKNKKSFH